MGKLPIDKNRSRASAWIQPYLVLSGSYKSNDRSYRFWKEDKWLRHLFPGRDLPNLLFKPQESPGLGGLSWAVNKIYLSRARLREFCSLA